MGQQWGDAAGLAGSQPRAQGTVGHHRGPRGGVEGRPHHLAELRHGIPGKMLMEGVLDQTGIIQHLDFSVSEAGPIHH